MGSDGGCGKEKNRSEEGKEMDQPGLYGEACRGYCRILKRVAGHENLLR